MMRWSHMRGAPTRSGTPTYNLTQEMIYEKDNAIFIRKYHDGMG